jgi:hypothetical protein
MRAGLGIDSGGGVRLRPGPVPGAHRARLKPVTYLAVTSPAARHATQSPGTLQEQGDGPRHVRSRTRLRGAGSGLEAMMGWFRRHSKGQP